MSRRKPKYIYYSLSDLASALRIELRMAKYSLKDAKRCFNRKHNREKNAGIAISLIGHVFRNLAEAELIIGKIESIEQKLLVSR